MQGYNHPIRNSAFGEGTAHLLVLVVQLHDLPHKALVRLLAAARRLLLTCMQISHRVCEKCSFQALKATQPDHSLVKSAGCMAIWRVESAEPSHKTLLLHP